MSVDIKNFLTFTEQVLRSYSIQDVRKLKAAFLTVT